jgi:hypothetical protein
LREEGRGVESIMLMEEEGLGEGRRERIMPVTREGKGSRRRERRKRRGREGGKEGHLLDFISFLGFT